VGTRADLYKNGHKRFRNVFLTSDFEHGADWDKTRKVSSPFLPLSAKCSAQKRRIVFSGIYAGKNGIKAVAEKVFSELLGICWHFRHFPLVFLLGAWYNKDVIPQTLHQQ